MTQRIKNYLVSLGPRNWIVQLALKLRGLQSGVRISFSGHAISLRRGAQELVMAEKDFYLLPFMMEVFGQAFLDIEGKVTDGVERLDFSRPGLQRYRKWGITLSFPGTPEDDSIEAYTQSYKPQPGDLIFDAKGSIYGTAATGGSRQNGVAHLSRRARVDRRRDPPPSPIHRLR